MNKKETTLLNAASEALDAHDEAKAHSVLTTSYDCPECGRTKLIAEVLEINDDEYRYDVDVRCGCGAKATLKV